MRIRNSWPCSKDCWPKHAGEREGCVDSPSGLANQCAANAPPTLRKNGNPSAKRPAVQAARAAPAKTALLESADSWQLRGRPSIQGWHRVVPETRCLLFAPTAERAVANAASPTGSFITATPAAIAKPFTGQGSLHPCHRCRRSGAATA